MVHAYIVLRQVLDVIPGNAYVPSCTPFPLPLLRIDGLADLLEEMEQMVHL